MKMSILASCYSSNIQLWGPLMLLPKYSQLSTFQAHGGFGMTLPLCSLSWSHDIHWPMKTCVLLLGRGMSGWREAP